METLEELLQRVRKQKDQSKRRFRQAKCKMGCLLADWRCVVEVVVEGEGREKTAA